MLHHMFKARGAKTWQHIFPLGFPVTVDPLDYLLFINIFHDVVGRIESRWEIIVVMQLKLAWVYIS